MNPVSRAIRKAKAVIHYLKSNARPIDGLVHYLSIGCIIKNEGRYLREWIEYHLWAGVEHFYIYDNGSTDNTKEVLAPYILSGKVTYHYFVADREEGDQQRRAYNDAISRYKRCTRWLALIDADEFLALSEEGKKRFGCTVARGGACQFLQAV